MMNIKMKVEIDYNRKSLGKMKEEAAALGRQEADEILGKNKEAIESRDKDKINLLYFEMSDKRIDCSAPLYFYHKACKIAGYYVCEQYATILGEVWGDAFDRRQKEVLCPIIFDYK